MAPGAATHDSVIGADNAAPFVASSVASGVATHDLVISADNAALLVASSVPLSAATHDMVIGADDAAPAFGGLYCGPWCCNSRLGY